MNNYLTLLNTKKFKEALEQAEKEVYLEAFKFTRYNQSATAKLLNVSRGTAIKKLNKYCWE